MANISFGNCWIEFRSLTFNLSSDRIWCVAQCPIDLVFLFDCKWNGMCINLFMAFRLFSCAYQTYPFLIAAHSAETKKRQKTCRYYSNHYFPLDGSNKQNYSFFCSFSSFIISLLWRVCAFIAPYSVQIMKLWSILPYMISSIWYVSGRVLTNGQKGNE